MLSDVVCVVGSGLRIIALTSARDHARFCDTDLKVVVFVTLLVGRWSDRDLVISMSVGQALFQGCCYVVAAGDSKPPALGGDYL